MSSANRSVVWAIGVAAALVISACRGGSSSRSPGTLAPPGGVTATAILTDITVDWTPVGGATSYNVYEGIVGSWYSHVSTGCALNPAQVGGRLEEAMSEPTGSRYFLVTASSSCGEGSTGVDAFLMPRDPSLLTCGP